MATDPREARIAGVAALDQPLRRRLYDLIGSEARWLGRDEAADALGLARSLTAFHLDKLAEAGLLEVRFERPDGRSGPGAGRPAKLYRRSRTELAVSVPERDYELAGALLLDAVQASTETGCSVNDALGRAARQAGMHVGEAVRAELPRHRTGRAVRRAAMEALRGLGYEPRDCGAEIQLANCPFHRLAERHRALVCGMNLDLIAGLTQGLGAQDRLVAELTPRPDMCCVQLVAG